MSETEVIMGKISPGKERDNRAMSKEEAKAEALRIIEEKLKNVEDKRHEEEINEGNNEFVGKKKSHFLSDLKVSYRPASLLVRAQLIIIPGLCCLTHHLPHGSWCRSSKGTYSSNQPQITSVVITSPGLRDKSEARHHFLRDLKQDTIGTS